ncbi:hypothetical protein BH09MYX1_BH09MYX1_54510 [soil metagenome]
MTVDLFCLVATALWGFVLVLIEVLGRTRAAGRAWNMGNRETTPDFPEWVNRCTRALANHKENFPFFLTAVLVVHVSGHASRVSAVASIVYLVARIAHGLLYTAGVTRVRSGVHILSVLASFVILSQLAV